MNEGQTHRSRLRTGLGRSALAALTVAVFALCALAGTASAKSSTVWLCKPGKKPNPCLQDRTATVVTYTGSTRHETVQKPVKHGKPAVDCFYVYPTVSDDQGLNSDLHAGREEMLAAQSQFARFSSVCRPFAPLYRQMTIASVAAYEAGADITQAAMLAYGDVLAAWRNYLRTRNQGRPFVLIGHSQGSLMLQQLIAREIEKDPIAARHMKLAIIPGYDVLVPQGKLVGGTFRRTPLCSRAGETGCIISWTSFREKNVPPEGAMFGFADRTGMTVGCVNPALPGSPDWVRLDSYWFTQSSYPVPGGPVQWSSEGPPPTPYVRTEGLVSGKCINDGQRGYLWIRTNHAPGDKRTDRIGGEVGVLGMFLPGWGMHLADVAEAEGDLIRAVGAISARSRTAARR
jgi:hypothetical protein